MLVHLGIARRLALALSVPLALALGLGASIVIDAWSRMHDADKVRTVMQIAPALGGFVHQVQTERGLTNTMLRNANDAAVVQSRREQMVKVDSAVEELRRALSLVPSSAEGGALAKIRTFDATIARLSGLRARVEARQIPPPEAVGKYTALVEEAIAPIEALAQDQRAVTVLRTLLAYTSVIRAKEAAGLERATGAGAFKPEGFDKSVLPRFLALGAAQESLLGVVRRLGLPDHAAAVSALATRPSEAPVVALRARAVKAALDGEPGIAPLEWFRASTARMEEMKKLEDQLSADLVAAVDGVAASARSTLIMAIVVIGLGLALAVATGLAMARSITRPLTRMT
ncbi:MAG: nitrate- and nitrite sensing domain-containing protein, partial [Alphaproteobacteria bacterium]